MRDTQLQDDANQQRIDPRTTPQEFDSQEILQAL
jgi:hypothetical protein